MDLVSPESEETARAMVKEGAGSEAPDPAARLLQFTARRVHNGRSARTGGGRGLDLTVAPIGVRHMLIKGMR